MSSFVRFVLNFKNDDSAIGDVARDMVVDDSLKRNWCYKTVVKHLEGKGACDKVYQILEEANERYKIWMENRNI